MEKAYHISELKFENGYLILTLDNQLLKLKLSEVSSKLSNASEKELNDFRISPSGYGIHWNLLDEDLSVNGLIKTAQEKAANRHLHI